MVNVKQAQKYCYEDISLIKNYDKAIADKTQTWDIHHLVETIMNCGAEELIAQGCYENRPAHDLIFLTKGEHNSLHKAGKKLSAKARANMSASHIGKKHSAKARAKMSNIAKISQNKPEVLAKQRAAKKGKRWWNNGIVQIQAFECPEGFVAGMLRS